MMSRPKPQIVAHRGASGSYPENTLPAFEAAMEAGADWLELDVVRARDGTLIVSHDLTVDRCTNGQGYIVGMTLQAIKQLDAGSWFDSKFEGVRIPTLQEVIDLTWHHPVGLVIEIKAETQNDFVATALAAAALAETRGHYVIESFNADCLRAVKDAFPAALTGFDLDPKTFDATQPLDEFLHPAIHSQADIINQHQSILTGEVVDMLHHHQREVWTWSIHEVDDLHRVVAAGADGIVTNYPARMLALLDTEEA